MRERRQPRHPRIVRAGEPVARPEPPAQPPEPPKPPTKKSTAKTSKRATKKAAAPEPIEDEDITEVTSVSPPNTVFDMPDDDLAEDVKEVES